MGGTQLGRYLPYVPRQHHVWSCLLDISTQLWIIHESKLKFITRGFSDKGQLRVTTQKARPSTETRYDIEGARAPHMGAVGVLVRPHHLICCCSSARKVLEVSPAAVWRNSKFVGSWSITASWVCSGV